MCHVSDVLLKHLCIQSTLTLTSLLSPVALLSAHLLRCDRSLLLVLAKMIDDFHEFFTAFGPNLSFLLLLPRVFFTEIWKMCNPKESFCFSYQLSTYLVNLKFFKFTGHVYWKSISQYIKYWAIRSVMWTCQRTTPNVGYFTHIELVWMDTFVKIEVSLFGVTQMREWCLILGLIYFFSV